LASHQETSQQPGRAGVPRSPAGRIPQWVLDDAAGIPKQPTAWRAPEPGRSWTGPDSPRRRDRVWGAIGIVIAVAEGTAPRPPVTAPGAGETRFSHRQTDGSPVTFSPCRPIHYVVRPEHSPPNGSRMIATAVAEVSKATGLRFVADGATDEPVAQDRRPYQPDRYGNRWAPVVIDWVTEDEDPDFGVDIAGNAGAQRVSRPGGQFTYVTGAIHLDPGVITELTRTHGEAVALRRAATVHQNRGSRQLADAPIPMNRGLTQGRRTCCGPSSVTLRTPSSCMVRRTSRSRICTARSTPRSPPAIRP
jgi:hypothetical protein